MEITRRIARIEVDYRSSNILTLLWNFDLLNSHFVSSVNICLRSSLLGIFFSIFKDSKARLTRGIQARGHNRENTIYQLFDRPFKRNVDSNF